MPLLHDFFSNSIVRRQLDKICIPHGIMQNLRAGYGERPYQTEAFRRFIFTWEEDFEEKPPRPFHVLYNMATGSGKTLIMAGLILYLYEKGYRNFIFFVNSNNIIQKTRDNFLNAASNKYLFRDSITLLERITFIKEVANFEEGNEDDIRIKFTTIQQLHLDLNDPKENKVTYEDLERHKIVLIADEAHHLSGATKGSINLFGSWEETVMKLHHLNTDNVLLEFTATIDYESREILNKYQSKVIYKYDLAQFRADKYSKEVSLLRSHFSEQERILQALILNLYREELAAAHYINLKPVVLFKAKQSIKESEKNKENFHSLIARLSESDVNGIRSTSKVNIVQAAFRFFDTHNIPAALIASRLKSRFRPENCISANDDTEAERNQIKLNTLEDGNNPIRAVFAVHKLNEGWDVLNLFDIVRLYEDSGAVAKGKTAGSTALSEAQLIGRGARYWPFQVNQAQDKFKRKYDNELSNELKVLEEIYYHTKEDSAFISKLKQALIESGIYTDEDRLVTRQLRLKPEFKQSEFYQLGRVVYNDRIEKDFRNVWSLSDLGVSKRNTSYSVASGDGKITRVFSNESEVAEAETVHELSIAKIPQHIVRFALSKFPFFTFASLKKHFPNLESTTEFMLNAHYMGNLSINFKCPPGMEATLSNAALLAGTLQLLKELQDEIAANASQYTCSAYKHKYIHEVFSDKVLRIDKDDERANGQEEYLADRPWYAYNANYGTTEEKALVRALESRIQKLQYKFMNIYLLRNERELKIYDQSGKAFEPDFLLFCKQKEGQDLTYQVFIEPKGEVYIANDAWKQEFLNKIKDANDIIQIDTDRYLITGLPFYTESNENEFIRSLEETLAI
jgi:type III restriction enzyme